MKIIVIDADQAIVELDDSDTKLDDLLAWQRRHQPEFLIEDITLGERT